MDLLEQIEAQVDLPVPLGRAAVVTLEGASWQHAVLVSSLHHVDQLDPNAKRALVRAAFLAVLRVAAQVGVTQLATAILQGGWRLSAPDAFSEMLKVAAQSSGPATTVYVIEPALHQQLHPLARAVGFREADV